MSGAQVTLPSVFGIANVSSVHAQLLSERGKPMVIDGSAVERMGGLGLQLLLAAAQTWQADKVSFSIVEASDALRAAVECSGATLPGVAQ
jgi:chemotaxis protein CheX